MARMRYEERRDEILRATLRVIIRKGFAAVTTRDVTAEVGVTHGLLHHYFPSRDELVAAAFELAATEDLAHLQEEVAGGTDPVDRLRRYLRYYGPTGDDPMMMVWVDAWGETSRNPVLARTTRRQNRSWQRTLRDIVAAGVDAGQMQADDPEEMAWVILGLLDGLAIQRTVARSVSPRQLRRSAHEVIERELGLAPGSLE